MRAIFVPLGLIGFSAWSLIAQSTSSVTGQVFDQAKAVVPDAEVIVLAVETVHLGEINRHGGRSEHQ